jgi:galactokinase
MPTELAGRARGLFAAHFGAANPPGVAFAPGRVNLIGEHTDYNDGFVLPMAIDRGVVIAFRPRADRRVRAHAALFAETRDLELDGIELRGVAGWPGYVAGVAWALEQAGHRVPGLDLVIDADLPRAAGLSSSAALEVATARAWCAAAGISWDAVAMARLCHRVENEFVGVLCGMMDQFAAAVSQRGCATLLDCRTLVVNAVTIPINATVVILDTGVRRDLATSAYADRRAACAGAVSVLQAQLPGITALRDVDTAMLDRARARLDPVVYRRALHVVQENARPAALAAALRQGDLPGAGRLLNESHASLRDLYEVSCEELDQVTERARAHPACFGARMTGAGFGGCAIALVTQAGALDFARGMAGAARAVFVARPEAGARLLVDLPGGGS